MSDALTFFATYIWPVLRHVTSNPNRCTNCIIQIPQNETVCESCRNFSPAEVPPPRPLTIKDDDKLLLLLSGGKDCLYILGELRRLYPHVHLECMLVDTGFLGPYALRNSKAGALATGTNLYVIQSYKDKFRATLRDAFLRLKMNPLASCYGVVDYEEGNLIFDIGINFAKENGMRIVSGLTASQLAMIDAPVKHVPNALFPLDAWRPTEEQKIAGAKKIAGKASKFGPLETNSILIPLMGTLDILRLGYCGFEIEFAKDIREGVTNRNKWRNQFDALKWLTENGLLDSTIENLLSQLQLSRKDVLP